MKSLPFVAVVIVLIVSSAVAVVWTSRSMEEEVSLRVATSLETVLNTTHEALLVWAKRTTTDASFIANSEEIRSAVDKQVRLPHERSSLVGSDVLRRLRQILRPYVEQNGYTDFALISPDGVQIASGLDEFLGQDTIARLNSASLANVFAGVASVGEPFQLPSDPRAAGRIRINMIVGAPIFNPSNEVMAALVFRLDPAREFSEITLVGRPGRTGETYIFDKQAHLLTQSRFEQDLPRLFPANRRPLFIQLRDPGVNTAEGFHANIPREKQPFTRMAESAIHGESGTDLHGYRDYRGVAVVGTWIWDDELGLGLATEIGLDEANSPVRTIWKLSTAMLLIVIIAVILLVRVVTHRAQLQAKNFGYEQALKARQDVLAIVAHDLRNPINSIALSSSVLTKALEGPNPDIGFVTQNLGVIQRSAHRMNRLIEDLLTSTRIESGQLRVQPRQCDLRPLLHEFEQSTIPLTAEKSIRFSCSISPDVPNAFVDPDRLSQVLSNLVGNAIKYAPVNGLVSLSVQLVNGEIEFGVRDSGPGISPSELPWIFDQYWQAQHNKGGTGLGLYISKGLVEAHGGRIWVESAVGEGTTVYFTVPPSKALAASPSI
jgi:signal transduction histidine kinase